MVGCGDGLVVVVVVSENRSFNTPQYVAYTQYIYICMHIYKYICIYSCDSSESMRIYIFVFRLFFFFGQRNTVERAGGKVKLRHYLHLFLMLLLLLFGI